MAARQNGRERMQARRRAPPRCGWPARTSRRPTRARADHSSLNCGRRNRMKPTGMRSRLRFRSADLPPPPRLPIICHRARQRHTAQLCARAAGRAAESGRPAAVGGAQWPVSSRAPRRRCTCAPLPVLGDVECAADSEQHSRRLRAIWPREQITCKAGARRATWPDEAAREYSRDSRNASRRPAPNWPRRFVERASER